MPGSRVEYLQLKQKHSGSHGVWSGSDGVWSGSNGVWAEHKQH